jgi:glycolate oxidase FAD binding subunit
MDLSAFAEAVGASGPVSIRGTGTRHTHPPCSREVRAPSGIAEFLPAEMTVRCGAGTPVDELAAALGASGQTVALPAGGTVGGALACGRSDVYRLGRGPVRDTLLQVRYVSAEGVLVKAGGATVKNVSGFDLCRLLVGSFGTLGFLGEVILRTRPKPEVCRWFSSVEADPFRCLTTLYKASSVLWDGRTTYVCLEGHAADVHELSTHIPAAVEVAGPPMLPTGSRTSVAPTSIRALSGSFVAEIGVGIVHHTDPWSAPSQPSSEVRALHGRIKDLFDPMHRLNPGLDVLDLGGGSP